MKEVTNNEGRNVRVDPYYSRNIYSGYLEGGPEPGDNERNIKWMKETSLKIAWPEPYVYLGNVDSTKILPHRGNIAWLTEIAQERHMVIIWFDDAEEDILVSLDKVLKDVDWETNSQEFCW